MPFRKSFNRKGERALDNPGKGKRSPSTQPATLHGSLDEINTIIGKPLM